MATDILCTTYNAVFDMAIRILYVLNRFNNILYAYYSNSCVVIINLLQLSDLCMYGIQKNW